MPVFLFTDIEGSSRMWEEHTDEMGAVIARHDAILQEQIGECGGRITKHTGDGVTAAFEGGQPIACALEVQKRFAAEAWGAVGELRIRAGLHAGEAEFQASAGTPAGDYFGPPVNATARVMSAAWGGQRQRPEGHVPAIDCVPTGIHRVHIEMVRAGRLQSVQADVMSRHKRRIRLLEGIGS